MSDEIYNQLRRAVLEVLGAKPAPERRRQVAADLRALAEQQERMAATAEQRPSQSAASAKPVRVPGAYVRIGREQDPLTGALRLRVTLGQQIWADIGSPERVDIQRVGGDIWIVPASGGAGHELVFGFGLPSCVVESAGPLGRLAPGRYSATIHAGAIVVGGRIG